MTMLSESDGKYRCRCCRRTIVWTEFEVNNRCEFAWVDTRGGLKCLQASETGSLKTATGERVAYLPHRISNRILESSLDELLRVNSSSQNG